MNRREVLSVFAATMVAGQTGVWSAAPIQDALERDFLKPPAETGLWVYWYWMYANVTREGITADLEAMAEAGIRCAALFTIGERSAQRTVVEKPADPLSPYWWELIEHAIQESDRLGLSLMLNACDGWATAGGPWITPEHSQQHLIWSDQQVAGGRTFKGQLAKPTNVLHPMAPPPQKGVDDYYRDVAVLAFPEPEGSGQSSESLRARVTSSYRDVDLEKIAHAGNADLVVDTDEAGWFQFEFEHPFVLRSIVVRHAAPAPRPGAPFDPFSAFPGAAYNIPAHSLEIEASDDGEHFHAVGKLETMLGGWMSFVLSLTHSVPEVTARFFRLAHRPGPVLSFDEQMHLGTRRDDNNRLRLASLVLCSAAAVHHLPGKSAAVWGKSRVMTQADAPAAACVPLNSIIDLTERMKADGTLEWRAPPGRWRVMRMGHASTGKTNSPAGTGQGLECDKFDPEAARLQFEGWFGEIVRHAGDAKRAIRVFHVDSWENGSQNWSRVFRDEFRRRRGYDLIRYLPAMAGVPVENGEITERFLLDVRTTIAELMYSSFFAPMSKLAHARGVLFSAEVTNVFSTDHLLHYEAVDIPMGEFWVDTFQNWKPLDIKEAVSGAHLYGKPIVQTESFTGGGNWIEQPGNLKALGDHNFAQGVNRFMLHVWATQPYPGRVPGIPGPAGTYFNAHQTWWKPAHAWFEYLRRCAALLQSGTPVVDALYYTGEDVPRRALVESKFGTTFVIDPPLPAGFQFDSINRDALLRLARVEDSAIVLASGARYRVLVLHPEAFMSPDVAEKIKALIDAGATVVGPRPTRSAGLQNFPEADRRVREIADELWGTGRVYSGTRLAEVLRTPDVEVGSRPERVSLPIRQNWTAIGKQRTGGGIEWNHRKGESWDLYFISNQEPVAVSTDVTFRIHGRVPELWYPDTGRIEVAPTWREHDGRISVPLRLDPAGSVFVVFRRSSEGSNGGMAVSAARTLDASTLEGEWHVTFLKPAPIRDDPPLKTHFARLVSWSENNDPNIRFYSGTATYAKTFSVPRKLLAKNIELSLDLGEVCDLAEVRLNGRNLGVLWKSPFTIEVSSVVKPGTNHLEIDVTNTWRNRLIGDAGKPVEQRVTWLHSPGVGGGSEFDVRIQANHSLLPAGLIGPVRLIPKMLRADPT